MKCCAQQFFFKIERFEKFCIPRKFDETKYSVPGIDYDFVENIKEKSKSSLKLKHLDYRFTEERTESVFEFGLTKLVGKKDYWSSSWKKRLATVRQQSFRAHRTTFISCVKCVSNIDISTYQKAALK